MAKLRSGIDFTGRLGDLTAYRMKGCKHTILRRCGGPSKHRIKTDPKFETLRLNNVEFGIRAQATSVFTKMLLPHKKLSDYNYSNTVSARMKLLQDLDIENALGQRSLLFSKYPELWEGFSLNEVKGFDSLVFAPLVCTISRETLSARIEIPELIPEINLSKPEAWSLYRIQAAFGLLPDFVFQLSRSGYVPTVSKERIAPVIVTTPWQPCLSTAPATVLTMNLPTVDVPDGFALMVSIGICFGIPQNGSGKVLQSLTTGAAKVLAVR